MDGQFLGKYLQEVGQDVEQSVDTTSEELLVLYFVVLLQSTGEDLTRIRM